jgi:hypothetical protein
MECFVSICTWAVLGPWHKTYQPQPGTHSSTSRPTFDFFFFFFFLEGDTSNKLLLAACNGGEILYLLGRRSNGFGQV